MCKLSKSTLRLLLSAATLLSVNACSPPEQTAAEPAAEYNLSLDMTQLMALVLEPASDVLWRNGGWVMDASGYEELYPTTDEGWDFVRAQAAVIVETGNALALPGRAADNDAWMIYSQGLSEAGLKAMAAAQARDKEAFFQAGAQLYSVCTACHQAYNPDILNRFDTGD
jgi:hypothetical protein